MWPVFLAVIKDLWVFMLEGVGLKKTIPHATFASRSQALNKAALEYIQFRLALSGITLPEVVRHDGKKFLHELLRGQPGVRINITPRKDAIMEVFDSEHSPHVLFVENVDATETLTVSSVSWYKESEFSIDTLGRAEWQEWRPIFINFEPT